MSLKVRGLLALTVGIGLGLSLSLGSGVLADREAEEEYLQHEDARLLAEVLSRVSRDYVDRVDKSELMERAIRGMVSGLDPHSAFLDSDEYQEIRISTTGNYTGVGLEVSMEDGQVRVVAPIDDTPAQRAGILPGDIIISIDDIPVDESNINDTVSKMRGKPGTPVSISVIREELDEPIEFPLVRANVLVRSVKSELLEPDYGYIRITHFSETTGRDVNRAITKLQRDSDSGLRGMILDLRNNPGGVLDAAVDVSDAFLDEGTIVTANGRVNDAKFRMDARPGDLLKGAELIVLVNGGSASASEIVAGALKDHERAVIMGTVTFGKGSVQTVMPLSNGRAIKLTTSRYYTPAGTSIHNRGITPNIVIEPEDNAELAGATTAESTVDDDHELQVALRELKSRRIRRSAAQ